MSELRGKTQQFGYQNLENNDSRKACSLLLYSVLAEMIGELEKIQAKLKIIEENLSKLN